MGKCPKMEISWKGNIREWKALITPMVPGVWLLLQYSEVVVPILRSIARMRK